MSFELQNIGEKAEPVPLKENQNEECMNTFDITDIIGDDGKWQRKIFYITFLCGISTAWNHLGISFLAFPAEYWCSRPYGSNISLQTWKTQFLPNITADGEVSYSQCEVFKINYTTDYIVHVSNETEKCYAWEFSSEYHSVTEEYDVVCEKTWMLSMSQSLYMLGFLVAVSSTGQLADLFGRRPAIIVNAVILLVASIATAFSTSFVMFVIFRCFVGLGQAGLDLAIFVLLTEIFGSSSRAIYMMLQTFSFCLGYLLLPLIAWLLSDWFYLQLFFALPCVYNIACMRFVPESPRWLLSKGHIERALLIMNQAAKENGINVRNMELQIQKIHSLEKKRKGSAKKVTFIDLFKMANLRKKTLYLFFIWITLAFTYYGLSFYSTELYGNKFLNYFFFALTEIPTSIFCVTTVNRYGRKKTLIASTLIGGLSCTAFIAIPKGYEIVQNTLAMLGKLFVGGAFNIIYLFSAEIFPTVARNAGVGICSTVARIGSALSPFMRDLGQATNPSVPLVLFGILCVISSVFLSRLPETNFKPIPETLQEAETAVSNEERKTRHIVFSLFCR